jgi:hypothetical protein
VIRQPRSTARRWLVVGTPLLLPAAVALGGCQPGAIASSMIQTPEYAADQAKCSVRSSASEPLIVEWIPADRAKLEALARQGVVVIKYEGCDMQVLAGCTVPDIGYRYVATTVKEENVSIRTTDELYAKLPFGAARLEATLEQSGELNVDMRIAGRYQASRDQIRGADLRGRCGDATHVISAVIVGAFTFATTGSAALGGGLSVFEVEGGGGTRAQRHVLSRDGDPRACDAAQLTDETPPAQCGALLRLEVTPLPEVEDRLRAARAADERRREDDAASAATWRGLGWAGVGLGVAAGALAGAFAYLGTENNEAIRAGGFESAEAIAAAESHGNTLNVAGWVLAGTAITLAGTGIGLVLAHPPPPPMGDAQGPLPEGVAVRIVGSLP